MSQSKEGLIGAKIEVTIYERDEMKSQKIYISQFEQDLGNELYKILLPIYEGKFVPLHVEQKLRLVYYTNKGIFGFSAVVTERESGTIPLLTIQAVSPIEKIQRREYFRFDCILPFEFTIMTDPQKYEGLVKNISGGGVCFLTSQKLETKSLITCIFNLNNEKFNCVGQILRAIPIDQSAYKFEVNVKFLKIQDEDREKIIKYIFGEQRKLQKKEKGLI